jgi:hypothetical protein
MLEHLVAFFKELDTGKRTMLRPDPVSFFKELDTGKELCSIQTSS